MEKKMAKLNVLVHLNAYSDSKDTNNPSMNNVRWSRDLESIPVDEPASKSLQVQPGQSMSLFSGTVSTSADSTTTWDIALKSGSSNTYKISHNGGTAPAFRTARSSGADATTEITVTKNAKLLKFESTGGTNLDLVSGGVQIGDEVRLGSGFSEQNQGKYKIISFNTTSFTVENETGVAEGPVTLGADYEEDIDIFSADGVQVGDKVDLVAGFSSVSFGTYEITDVSHDFIEIFSNESLPSETAVSNNPEAFLIYTSAKSFLYLESDQDLSIKLNGSTVTNKIEPIFVGSQKKPGLFMSSSSIKSAEIENTSQSTANVFYVTAE